MSRLNRGQALTETLVAMLVMVPVFMLIPYLGKYLDVKHKTQDGARYAIWERSLFSDGGASWDSGENTKSDDRIAAEIKARFTGDPRVAIVDGGGANSRNLLWEDHKGGNLVPLDDFAPAVNEVREPFPYGLQGRALLGKPESLSVFGSLARDGLPIVNNLDGLSDILGGAFDFTLGLNARGFATSRVELPVLDLPGFRRAGAILDIDVATDLRTLTANSAMLTDAWVPGSEGNYVDRLDGLIIDEITSFLVAPGTFTFGFFPLFIEGLDGQNPTLESESNALPERYIDD